MFFQIKSIREEVFTWLDRVQSCLVEMQNLQERKVAVESEVVRKGPGRMALRYQQPVKVSKFACSDYDALSDASEQRENDEFGFLERKGLAYQISVPEMKKLILEHITDFAQMDNALTVKICEQWFEKDYNTVALALKDSKDLAYNFLNAVLAKNEDKIINECEESGFNRPSEKYNELMLLFVEILCHKKYRNKICDYVTRSYFPIGESLKICEEREALEASAILCKRNSDYFKAVELYTRVLVDLGKDIVHTLFTEMFSDMNSKNEHIKKFDEVMTSIVKICDKQSSKMETNTDQVDLWKHALKSMFSIKDRVYHILESEDAEDNGDNLAEEDRENFRKFLNFRHQLFIQQMSEYVNLNKIVSFLEDEGHVMEFEEFKQTFKDKVRQESYTEDILYTAKRLLRRDLQQDSQTLHGYLTCGVYINQRNRCDHCKLKFDYFTNG